MMNFSSVLAMRKANDRRRGRQRSFTLVVLLLVFLVPVLATNYSTERLRGRRRHLSSSTTLCRIILVEHWSELPNGVLMSAESAACVPIVSLEETGDLFTIADLPGHILDDNAAEIKAGTFFVSITNTKIVNGALSLDPDSEIQICQDPRRSQRTIKTLSKNATGNKTIAVIRISTLDATPTADAATIADRLFSTDEVNFKTQYAACSFGKLQWELAPAGIVDVKVNKKAAEFRTGASLVAAAQEIMSRDMNIQASQLADKVMMCLPSGIGRGWIASSGVDHWRTQFNDEWCLSLTAGMHELGHSLGLLHSNKGGKAYGDLTGYMSFGRKEINYPRKCFNGLHNWQLGWYQDRHLSIETVSDQESYLIKLATFVDYEKTNVDEPVLVQVLGQFVLQYNRAKGMNVDTEDKEDQVTITAEGQGGSDLLAGLSVGDHYTVQKFRGTTRQLIIVACEETKSEAGADIMLVSVSLDGQMVCPDFYNEGWSTAVAIVHQNQNLPRNNDADSVPANGAPPDIADNSDMVGRDGFWDLFDDRHNQKPPNFDSLVKSANAEYAAEPKPQSTGTSGSIGSSSILQDFLGENKPGEGHSTSPSVSRFFENLFSRYHSDGQSEEGGKPDSWLVTSVYEYWFDQEP